MDKAVLRDDRRPVLDVTLPGHPQSLWNRLDALIDDYKPFAIEDVDIDITSSPTVHCRRIFFFSKNDRAHAGLSEQFAAHSLERAYQALVWGAPRPAKGEISGNVGRSPANRKKMAVLARGGKPALPRYKMRRRVGTKARLVDCRLTTGRTHQIRVHMANIGCPVVGDPLYGGGKRRLRGRGPDFCDIAAAIQSQALHAYLLGFRHPGTGKTLRFQSKLPCYFNILMERLDGV